MTNSLAQHTRIASIGAVMACIGDWVVLFVLGRYYPGYSQLEHSISSLGASNSPVAQWAEISWLIIGLLFIWFGVEFGRQYRAEGTYAKVASWLIILYGAGEGLGSAFFKVDSLHHSLSFIGIIHQLTSIYGVLAILLLPLVIKRLFPFRSIPGFPFFSDFVFALGGVLLGLFLCRFFVPADHPIVRIKGLWQRLLLFTNYIYILTAIYFMWKTSRFRPVHKS